MDHEFRQYNLKNSAAFKKTKEQWGNLSNMAGGFPVVVNGVYIRSIEALYQSCRYPHLPEIQKDILSQSSPMTAKKVGKPFLHETRPNWEIKRIAIMKWSLRVKLAQNWELFSSALFETENMPIVEISDKDTFWGARPINNTTLSGTNALGRLLMQLREQIMQNDRSLFLNVPPLEINDFNLYGKPILTAHANDNYKYKSSQDEMFK